MHKLSQQQYEHLIADSEILDGESAAPGLLLSAGDKLIRRFPAPGWLERLLRYPHARRFAENAQRLNSFGIKTIQVTDVQYCPSEKCALVSYMKPDGRTLRELFNGSLVTLPFMHQLAEYLARLHYKSITLPNISLDDILLTRDAQLMISNVEQVKFGNTPMGPFSRLKNFQHMLNVPQDRIFFQKFGIKRFLKSYVLASRMSTLNIRIFLNRISAAYGQTENVPTHDAANDPAMNTPDNPDSADEKNDNP